MTALTDWLHAQDSYTPSTQLSPGSLHPTREGLLSTDGLDVALYSAMVVGGG